MDVDDRARNGAVGQSRLAVLDKNVLLAQLIGAVGAPRRPHGVGDQTDAVRAQVLEGGPDHRRMDVESVADQLGVGVRIEDGPNRAGLPVGEAHHGVVHVGVAGGSGLIGGQGLVVPGGGVGHADGADLGGFPDEVHAVFDLRGQVHLADAAAGELVQLGKEVEVRRQQVLQNVGPPLFHGKEGPFHVDADHPCAAGLGLGELAVVAEDLPQRVRLQGGGGAQGGGDAGLQIGVRHGLKGLLGAIAEVGAAAAVGVDVHKAGDQPLPGDVLDLVAVFRQIRAHLRDFSVLDPDVRLFKGAVFHENQAVFEQHVNSSLKCAAKEPAAKCHYPHYTTKARRRQTKLSKSLEKNFRKFRENP